MGTLGLYGAAILIGVAALYFLTRASRKRGAAEANQKTAEQRADVAEKRLEIANSPPDSDDELLDWLRGSDK